MKARAAGKSDRLHVAVRIERHRGDRALVYAGGIHGVCVGDDVLWGPARGRISLVEVRGSIAQFFETMWFESGICQVVVGVCCKCSILQPVAKIKGGKCCASCGWVPGTRA